MVRARQVKDQQAGPERKCLATGDLRKKTELIRFVAGPDGQLVADIASKLPGRGFYVMSERHALEAAIAKRVFARGARAPVVVPDGLVEDIERQLATRVVNLISLARKAGTAVAGYEKVKSWLDQERARVLIQASDGSARGKSKLSTPHLGNFIGWLSADELGLAFGRQTVIHGALGSGGLTQRVVEEATRLKGLRLGKDGRASGKEKKLNERK